MLPSPDDPPSDPGLKAVVFQALAHAAVGLADDQAMTARGVLEHKSYLFGWDMFCWREDASLVVRLAVNKSTFRIWRFSLSDLTPEMALVSEVMES